MLGAFQVFQVLQVPVVKLFFHNFIIYFCNSYLSPSSVCSDSNLLIDTLSLLLPLLGRWLGKFRYESKQLLPHTTILWFPNQMLPPTNPFLSTVLPHRLCLHYWLKQTSLISTSNTKPPHDLKKSSKDLSQHNLQCRPVLDLTPFFSAPEDASNSYPWRWVKLLENKQQHDNYYPENSITYCDRLI